MNTHFRQGRPNSGGGLRVAAFTLVELLAVVAIIGLLIAILMPALHSARVQAWKAQTASTLKAIGDGAEMFRGENQKEFRLSDGYPPSARANDPTEPADTEIFGAHWLLRYLMGKDLNGFVPRRSVPQDMQAEDTFNEQEHWYDPDALDNRPLDRVGPYLTPDSLTVKKTKELPGATPDTSWSGNEALMNTPVIVDAFGYPILYYVANPRWAKKPGVPMAVINRYNTYETHDPAELSSDKGIFAFDDNMLFTGLRDGVEPSGTMHKEAWNFGGFASTRKWHDISYFGPDPIVVDTFRNNPRNFLSYIMNQRVFESTYDATVPRATMTPHRKESFLLISAGSDAIYGTNDDVGNFSREE